MKIYKENNIDTLLSKSSDDTCSSVAQENLSIILKNTTKVSNKNLSSTNTTNYDVNIKKESANNLVSRLDFWSISTNDEFNLI